MASNCETPLTGRMLTWSTCSPWRQRVRSIPILRRWADPEPVQRRAAPRVRGAALRLPSDAYLRIQDLRQVLGLYLSSKPFFGLLRTITVTLTLS